LKTEPKKDNRVILTFAGHFLPGYKGGGPIKTIKNLLDRVGQDISFKLITSDRDLGDTAAYTSVRGGTWSTVGHAQVFYAPPGIISYMKVAKIIFDRKYDIVYINSFFSSRFSFFPLLIARLLRQRIILAPRGEFSQGALSMKARKKQLFIRLYRFLRLHRCIVFQASSNYEAEDIRRVFGLSMNIIIAEDIGSQDFAEILPHRMGNRLRAVFISRISPMKNLLTALEILQDVHEPVLYHIYGPIEDRSYWARCEVLIKSLPPHIKVEYKGELTPDQVVPTLSAYDLFFMPTKGENYGHVIAEALCAGLPILITDKTPWRKLHEQGIGWDLPLSDLRAFSAVIDELALLPTFEHLKMRESVLAWAKNKFSQRDVIDANITMFRNAYDKL
tara:strand:- start:2497 stop:3663 length:1167 start_codon:yes stop_codon:yes gene_type:complete